MNDVATTRTMKERWLRIGVFTSCAAGTAGALMASAALTTTLPVEAQTRAEAGDADATVGPTCSFAASGDLTSQGACTARVIHHAAAGKDGSSFWDTLYIDGHSSELQSIHVWIAFHGRPEGAIVHAPSAGAPFFGRADVKANTGVEWMAMASIQGKFDLNLTKIRPLRVEGGISYELHGELEIELPVSNLPNPRRTLTLKIGF